MHKVGFSAVAFAVLAATAGGAQTIDLKYGGPVDLAPFQCQTAPSGFIGLQCYDAATNHLVIELSGLFFEYCGIDPVTVAGLASADSPGQFYNAEVKGRFDCRA